MADGKAKRTALGIYVESRDRIDAALSKIDASWYTGSWETAGMLKAVAEKLESLLVRKR